MNRAALPGTRPEGIQDEREAGRYVRELFSRIAPRYDFLNHLLSLSFDRLWRRRTAQQFRHIVSRSDARVLDLCCGTGDLTFALAKEGEREARKRGGKEAAQFWGSDFAHPMVRLACEKARAIGRSRDDRAAPGGIARFVEADALVLPFGNESFDLVTAAFGFRNLTNYEAGLREIHRILRPGGEVGILEFAEPRLWPIAPLYRLYFTHLLPRIGGAISGNRSAYTYLPSSVFKFPSPEELCQQMASSGFVDARYEAWTGGIVALHRARRR